MAGSARLAVLRLGRIGWTQAEVVQKALVASKTEAAAAIRGRRATAATGQGDSTGAPAVPDDVLLLCEHPPVYTTGRRMQVQPCMVFAAHCLPMPTPRSHTVGVCMVHTPPPPPPTPPPHTRLLQPDPQEQRLLENLGAEYLHCQRGGQTTFHGPGQLVGYARSTLLFSSFGCDWLCPAELAGSDTIMCDGGWFRYPIVDLRALGGGTRCFVHALEETMIRTCAEFGVSAIRSEHTGVWVGSNKIGAIGIQVSRGMTWHGFALNCATDLSWFGHIGNPLHPAARPQLRCGLNSHS
jgi:lipoate-protein ligase B